MKEFIEKLHQELAEELAIYADLGALPVKRLSGALNATSAALQKIREYIETHPFENRQQEINFFKYLKPPVMAEKLYALEIYTIETNRPLVDEVSLRVFYEQELKYIRRFFMQHQFLYQYYQLDAVDLDQVFFVREAKPTDIIIPSTPELDPTFSTAADFLFAKFIAYEKVQDYLMDCLYGQGKALQPFRSKKGRLLEWTGDKSNLVELAYAIHDTMQINNGEVDISDIIDWLEQSLQVNLGRYYKRFSEMKMRKNVSRTRYLDFMVEMILKHMEEGDSFQPQPLKPVSGSRRHS